MSKVKIQLAVQGGGAKLISLLAAMEAIQELQTDKLEITNIAGTSAGSIAGSFLAAGVSMPVVKQRLININAKLINKHFPKNLRKFFTNIVLLRKSVWQTKPLRTVLEEIFNEKNIKEIGQCKIPIKIIATDLTDGQVEEFKDSDNLVNAILDSCGLPYFFTVWDKNGVNRVLVDGGICENLPSDYLKDENEDNGDIIGISFTNDISQKTPANLIEFTSSLLNTAILHSVNRAKRRIRSENLLELKTKIDTFDFEKAIKDLNNEWEIAKSQTTRFFEKHIENKTKPLPPEPESKEIDFTESYDQIVDKIKNIYESQHDKSKFHYEDMKLRVTANSLFDKTRYDEVILSLKFRTGDNRLYCHRFSLKNEEDESVIKSAEFKVFDNTNKEIKTTYLYSSPKKDKIILFFDDPLPANSTKAYTITCQAEISNMISDNKLSLEAFRSHSAVNAEIILQIPKDYKNISINGNLGREIKQRDLSPRVNYNQLGWRTTRLAPNQKFVVDIIKR